MIELTTALVRRELLSRLMNVPLTSSMWFRLTGVKGSSYPRASPWTISRAAVRNEVGIAGVYHATRLIIGVARTRSSKSVNRNELTACVPSTLSEFLGDLHGDSPRVPRFPQYARPSRRDRNDLAYAITRLEWWAVARRGNLPRMSTCRDAWV